MRSGQHVRRTDEDSSSERVASLGLRLDSADPAKWDLGCVGDRTHGGADRRLSDAPCSGPWGRLPEVGPGSPAAGCAERVRAPAGGVARLRRPRHRCRTAFFFRHIPLPKLCALSAARGACTPWAAAKVAQRTRLCRDVKVCHSRLRCSCRLTYCFGPAGLLPLLHSRPCCNRGWQHPSQQGPSLHCFFLPHFASERLYLTADTLASPKELPLRKHGGTFVPRQFQCSLRPAPNGWV